MSYKNYCPNCVYSGCSAAEISASTGKIYVKCPRLEIKVEIDGTVKKRSMFFYKELPTGMRVASMDDLTTCGVLCLVKSFYTGRFETKVITERTNMDELLLFVQAGHCFVKI